MPALLVVATLEPAAGADAETAVNTFAFGSDVDVDAAVQLDILNAVASFYTGVPTGGTAAVGTYLTPRLSRSVGECSLKMYDITGHLDGSPHGSPIAEGAFTLPAAGSGQALPPQAAVAITLRARNALLEPVEGAPNIRPRQRKTGRIYIGPLNLTAVDSDTGVGDQVKNAMRDNLMRACEDLQDALVDGDYAWGVWSRAEQDLIPVTRVEVDNSFDVIRSRKRGATVRDERTFAPAPALVLGA